MKRAALAIAIAAAAAASIVHHHAAACTHAAQVITVNLGRYPHILQHANTAIAHGYPTILTIHRAGAPARRRRLLAHIPTRPGMDRDEYPPDIGRDVTQADVAYVPSSENRAAGAALGNALRDYCDASRFRYQATP
jgi:hypothetical protein